MQMETNPQEKEDEVDNEVETSLPKEVRIMQDKADDDELEMSLLNMESDVFPSNSKRCIYTVPEHIKKGKEEYYRPLVISIGPVFYKDPNLESMQELKRMYLKSFREHPNNVSQSLKPYIKYVREHESEILECYEEKLSLPSDEFVQMIVLDAAFLIYHFLVIYNNNGPFIGNKLELLTEWLNRDLLLEQNQLPFFVIKNMYNIAYPDLCSDVSITDLSLMFLHISDGIPGAKAMLSIIQGDAKIMDATNIQHLVDLQHMCCCHLLLNNHRKSEGKQKELEATTSIIDCKKMTSKIKCRGELQKISNCLPFYRKQKELMNAGDTRFHDFGSAKHLSVAGVKFKVSENYNITFDKRKGVLKLPKLTLSDDTESVLRSILFFEQCHHVFGDTYFLDYIFILDTLIDTVEDIQVLRNTGVLENILGSDDDAAKLFNEVAKHIGCTDDYSLSKITKDLKDYASTRRNRWKAILWSKYFNHPWAIISVIYAIVLLTLTIIQTIAAFTSK